MGYGSETEKIRPRVLKYCQGNVMDIGCGHDPIVPDAFGVDMRRFPHVRFITTEVDKLSRDLPHMIGKFDAVYSSHALEHFDDDIAALMDWERMVKSFGHIILYLPDDRWYDNKSNPEHKQIYTSESFHQKIKDHFPEWIIKEFGEDHGDDRYSFYMVAQVPAKLLHVDITHSI